MTKQICIKIRIHLDSSHSILFELVDIDDSITGTELLAVFHERCAELQERKWSLLHRGNEIELNQTLSSLLSNSSRSLEINLIEKTVHDQQLGKNNLELNPTDSEEISVFSDEDDFNLTPFESDSASDRGETISLEDSDLFASDSETTWLNDKDMEAQPQLIQVAEDKRQATVRYYSRMNPGRVYPLKVIISRGLVPEPRSLEIKQVASRPFSIDAQEPIDVEPVLPGCDCHPARLTIFAKDFGAEVTFRVFPKAIGKLDGATIIVRQKKVRLMRFRCPSMW